MTVGYAAGSIPRIPLNLVLLKGITIAGFEFGSFMTHCTDEMLRNDEDYELVRSMLDLIYRFGKLAVAEGIETDEQLVALRSMGCEYGQGFHLSRPVPFEVFPAGEILPRGLPLKPT